MANLNGLSVAIYRNNDGDCTLGGVSSVYDDAILIGDGIKGANWSVPEDAEFHFNKPVFRLVRAQLMTVTTPGGISMGVPLNVFVIPNEYREKQHLLMFGGNYVATSDSRFHAIAGSPLRIHDRDETYRISREDLYFHLFDWGEDKVMVTLANFDGTITLSNQDNTPFTGVIPTVIWRKINKLIDAPRGVARYPKSLE
jgi:hypothetical protein